MTNMTLNMTWPQACSIAATADVRYTHAPPIQINAVRSVTRTTNQRPCKWTAVNADNLNTCRSRVLPSARPLCLINVWFNKRLWPLCHPDLGGMEIWLGVIRRKSGARQWRAHPNDQMLSQWIILTFAPAIPPQLSAVSIPLHLLSVIFSRLYSPISVSSCDAPHYYWTRKSTTLYSSNVVFTIRPSTNHPRFISINTRFTSFNPRFNDS